MTAFSTLCITHRKGELLRRTLTKLGKALGELDEALVIDDGGHDAGVFEEVAAGNGGARMRYVSVPHRGYRLSLLCNIGVMLAAHERIVKIDGDVVPRAGWLEAYRRRLRPGSLVCGRIEWRLEDGRVARDSRFDYDRRQGCVGPRKSYGGNLGFTRADLLALGMFGTEYHGAWGAEDAEIGEKYAASGRSVVFAFEAVAEHQWHPLSPYRSGAGKNRRLLQRKVLGFRKGRLPKAVRRDVLHVVGEGARDPEEIERWLAGLNLPHRVWQEPIGSLRGRIDSTGFVLLIGGGDLPSASTVDSLYAHLKADERCAAVAPASERGGCVLWKGPAIGRAASEPWSGVAVLPAGAGNEGPAAEKRAES